MSTRRRRCAAGVAVALVIVFLTSLVLGGGERLEGIGAGMWIAVQGVRLAQYGVPVAIMGQLTRDGEPVPGSIFYLFYNPAANACEEEDSGVKDPPDMEEEPYDPEIPPGPAVPTTERTEIARASSCSKQLEYYFPQVMEANGAQISYIQFPNGIVTFAIAPTQFSPGQIYELPFLPEDPPGAGALEFF